MAPNSLPKALVPFQVPPRPVRTIEQVAQTPTVLGIVAAVVRHRRERLIIGGPQLGPADSFERSTIASPVTRATLAGRSARVRRGSPTYLFPNGRLASDWSDLRRPG